MLVFLKPPVICAVSGVKIPFFVGATVDAAGSGAIADLSLSISMLVKVYNTDGTPMASCTYTTDSNAPYNVACATNVTMSPEPSSALLCGAGCVLVYLRRSRLMRLLR